MSKVFVTPQMVREEERPCVRGFNRLPLMTSLVLKLPMKYLRSICLIRIIGVHALCPQEQVIRGERNSPKSAIKTLLLYMTVGSLRNYYGKSGKTEVQNVTNLRKKCLFHFSQVVY